MSFKRILAAVDESSFAARAATVGIELAKALNAELAFIHAIAPASVSLPEGGVPADVWQQRRNGMPEICSTHSASVRQQAPPHWHSLSLASRPLRWSRGRKTGLPISLLWAAMAAGESRSFSSEALLKASYVTHHVRF